ncbi:MAG: hypothetical protein JXQ76_10835 [Campylobacterales bacterium]|nr:hypothetical protein [Campylobacterales bacterium]
MSIKDSLTQTRQTKKGESESSFRWWVTGIMALVLSLGTWNPTGFHFLHYISSSNPLSGFTPFAILIMLGLWLLAIRSIFQSLGLFGALFIVIIILAFVWGLNQYGLIDLKDFDQLGWIATIGMAIIIWAGLNASKMWKQITGVYATDSKDEPSE